MKKISIVILLFLPLIACSSTNSGDDSGDSTPTKKNSEVYMEKIGDSSLNNHLYIHYYRYDNQASSYSNWLVWAYNVGDDYGTRFDWSGRTQIDLNTVTGDASIDEAGAVVDIELGKTYVSMQTSIGGTFVSVGDNVFDNDSLTLLILSTTINQGFSRNTDGSPIVINLSDYKIMRNEKTFYHVFLLQSNTNNPLSVPTFLD